MKYTNKWMVIPFQSGTSEKPKQKDPMSTNLTNVLKKPTSSMTKVIEYNQVLNREYNRHQHHPVVPTQKEQRTIDVGTQHEYDEEEEFYPEPYSYQEIQPRELSFNESYVQDDENKRQKLKNYRVPMPSANTSINDDSNEEMDISENEMNQAFSGPKPLNSNKKVLNSPKLNINKKPKEPRPKKKAARKRKSEKTPNQNKKKTPRQTTKKMQTRLQTQLEQGNEERPDYNEENSPMKKIAKVFWTTYQGK